MVLTAVTAPTPWLAEVTAAVPPCAPSAISPSTVPALASGRGLASNPCSRRNSSGSLNLEKSPNKNTAPGGGLGIRGGAPDGRDACAVESVAETVIGQGL